MSRFIGITISAVFVLGSLAASGCSGDSRPQPASCKGPIEPGPTPIRRLTRVEYNNTVFQLLGDSSRPADLFPADEEAGGFDNQAAAQTVSPLLAEQYMLAAETLARNNSERLMRSLPACTDGTSQAACAGEAERFIRDFGKRAFRRPLSEDEVATHKALFEQGTLLGDAEYSPRDGVELVVQAMLQSPHFLYRVEFGTGQPVAGDVVPLTSWEIASRLSYLLWNTMPDVALLEAAEADELRDPAQIELHARRMMETPRAREAVKNFHRQWLKLGNIETALRANGKDEEIYPEYSELLLSLWRQETEEFIDYAVFEENARVDTLFTASYTMMNRALAEFYGVPNKPAGDAFERVDLDPAIYSGILTQPGLLALYSKPDRSSPIHRGKFVREAILCQSPPPPPDVVPEPPSVDTTQTTRDQFLEHAENPLCAGCHRFMDPIGFGLEHFDGIGRYRPDEWGLPIDATGFVHDAADATGEFDGAVELANLLGNSNQVRDCVTKQWFRFAYGRSETTEDTCSMDLAREMFAAANYDIKELVVALTQTNAFRYRRAITDAEVAQ